MASEKCLSNSSVNDSGLNTSTSFLSSEEDAGTNMTTTSFLSSEEDTGRSMTTTGEPEDCIGTKPSIPTSNPLRLKGEKSLDEISIYVDSERNSFPSYPVERSNSISCRICQMSSGKLLQPCGCKGTMAFIHGSCLNTWLNTKGKLECELCQVPYKIKGRCFKPLGEWNRPKMDRGELISYLVSVCLIGWFGFLLCYYSEQLIKREVHARIQDSEVSISPSDVCFIVFTVFSCLGALHETVCLFLDLGFKLGAYLNEQRMRMICSLENPP